jgi:DNA-binding beta-propeller fold protein YncE
VIDQPPTRTLEDDHPVFSGIALDEKNDEVVISNNNKASFPSILTYPIEFQQTDRVMEPRRRIAGSNADLGDVCALAVSPENKEIYTVQGESRDLQVFPLDGNGNIGATRTIATSHGNAGLYLDEKNNELYITTEHIHRVSVYRRNADKDEGNVRFIQGPHTQLADPHGIYADTAADEVFVTNHGNYRETPTGEDNRDARFYYSDDKKSGSGGSVPAPLVPSTGKFLPASVTIYPRLANGDVAPTRVIAGSKTKLNLPQGVFRDPSNGAIIVANSGDDSVLFFDKSANGDAAPIRQIKGAATKLGGPTSVFVDSKRHELWVTSWESHITTVFSANADGNVAPLRYIRSAPQGIASASFGTPGTVVWDPIRKEVLVAN